MSSKKLDYRQFFRLRKQIGTRGDQGDTPYEGMGITLNEFNKVVYGKRNVLIEFPTFNRTYMEFAALYAAIRMGFQGMNIKAFCTLSALPYMLDDYYKDIVPKSMQRKKDDRLWCTGFKRILWTSVVDSFNDYMFVLPDLSSDTVFKDEGIDKLRLITDTIEMYRYMTPKRVIALYPHVVGEKDNVFLQELTKFKKEYADKFLFIDYTKERELVDLWMKKDSFWETGFVDPEFDMKLASPGLNLNYIFNYMATNYSASFKEYAKLNEEYVSQYMNREDLRNFIKPSRYGKPYGKVCKGR